MKNHNILILVTDIESDGPQLAKNSMRSFCSVAVCPESKKIIGEFWVNLNPIVNGIEDKDTVENFFKGQFPDAWNDLNQNPQDPKIAMNNYLDWLDSLQAEKFMFCASPISYDKAWMVWYAQEYCSNRLPNNPRTPYVLSDFDLKCWQTGLLGASPTEANNLLLPQEWNSPLPHTHIARDDARLEADELIRRLNWLKSRTQNYTKIL